jgi:hypothetical protein
MPKFLNVIDCVHVTGAGGVSLRRGRLQCGLLDQLHSLGIISLMAAQAHQFAGPHRREVGERDKPWEVPRSGG